VFHKLDLFPCSYKKDGETPAGPSSGFSPPPPSRKQKNQFLTRGPVFLAKKKRRESPLGGLPAFFPPPPPYRQEQIQCLKCCNLFMLFGVLNSEQRPEVK